MLFLGGTPPETKCIPQMWWLRKCDSFWFEKKTSRKLTYAKLTYASLGERKVMDSTVRRGYASVPRNVKKIIYIYIHYIYIYLCIDIHIYKDYYIFGKYFVLFSKTSTKTGHLSGKLGNKKRRLVGWWFQDCRRHVLFPGRFHGMGKWHCSI